MYGEHFEERPPILTAGQRIGDAERDVAAAVLSEHFAAGRLDRDEFDVRLSATYRARTAGELDPLFADLPATPAVARSTPSVKAAPRRPRGFAVPVLPLVLLVAAVTMASNGGRFHGILPKNLVWCGV